jgi:hypothetical protein
MADRLFPLVRSAALAAVLALAACGGGSDEADLADLDNRIANNADPALTSALEDQIMVDPMLSQQSNRFAVRPPESPVTAQYPLTSADIEAARTGRGLTPAPAPTKAADDQVADARAESATCGANFEYDPSWATRLPAAFAVYPGARVTDAAGVDTGECRMRVATFTTDAPWKRVLDWYHTRAIRAGYSSEHQLRGADHILGGVNERDGGAFYLVVTPKPVGADVAIIANNGR